MSTDFGATFKTARAKLFDLLSDLKWHTHKELLGVASVRYGARLLELKRLGYKIDSEGKAVNGKRYRLTDLKAGTPKAKQVKVFIDEIDVEHALNHNHISTAMREAMREALLSFQFNKAKL